MTRAEQKQWEAIVLASLCERLPSVWSVEEDHRESPDGVILTPDGSPIGVELVRYRASDRRERAVRSRLLAKAGVHGQMAQGRWIAPGALSPMDVP